MTPAQPPQTEAEAQPQIVIAISTEDEQRQFIANTPPAQEAAESAQPQLTEDQVESEAQPQRVIAISEEDGQRQSATNLPLPQGEAILAQPQQTTSLEAQLVTDEPLQPTPSTSYDQEPVLLPQQPQQTTIGLEARRARALLFAKSYEQRQQRPREEIPAERATANPNNLQPESRPNTAAISLQHRSVMPCRASQGYEPHAD